MRIRNVFLAACLAACLWAVPGLVLAQTDGSVALTTSPLQIFAANPNRLRLKLINYSGTGATPTASVYIWCRLGTVAAAPAAVNGTGSFVLAPGGGGIDDVGAGYVDVSAVNCLAESGTPILFARQY